MAKIMAARRKRARSRFFVVKVGNRTRLVPIPANPAKDLAMIGRKLPKKSTRQLREEILKQARKE